MALSISASGEFAGFRFDGRDWMIGEAEVSSFVAAALSFAVPATGGGTVGGKGMGCRLGCRSTGCMVIG
jgi:hypothetical protein